LAVLSLLESARVWLTAQATERKERVDGAVTIFNRGIGVLVPANSFVFTLRSFLPLALVLCLGIYYSE